MKKIVKSKGMMVSSIISLLLSLVVLATVSLAWLSMNKETESNGMQLKVEVTPNLIIDSDTSSLQSVDGAVESNFSVDLTAAAASLKPATHDDGSANGLVYVVNPSAVDVSSGLVKSGSVLTYSSATSSHYVDFTVYIASAGAEMPGQDLVAELKPQATIAGSSATKQDTLDATSVDFYVQTYGGSLTYKGTLNVAGLDAEENDYTTTETAVTLVSNQIIPKNKDGYITVVMRCYFDGALLKSSGHAYINSALIDTNEVTLNVTFTASDAS